MHQAKNVIYRLNVKIKNSMVGRYFKLAPMLGAREFRLRGERALGPARLCTLPCRPQSLGG